MCGAVACVFTGRPFAKAPVNSGGCETNYMSAAYARVAPPPRREGADMPLVARTGRSRLRQFRALHGSVRSVKPGRAAQPAAPNRIPTVQPCFPFPLSTSHNTPRARSGTSGSDNTNTYPTSTTLRVRISAIDKSCRFVYRARARARN